MKYLRLLQPAIQKAKKSVLLIGPRQTGKSTLLRGMPMDLYINFSNEQTYLEYTSQPDKLRSVLESRPIRKVFIDEVQRIPSVLNTIQFILDEGEFSVQFYLSGF
jgi:predicted AAA+ superfamily ATPase